MPQRPTSPSPEDAPPTAGAKRPTDRTTGVAQPASSPTLVDGDHVAENGRASPKAKTFSTAVDAARPAPAGAPAAPSTGREPDDVLVESDDAEPDPHAVDDEDLPEELEIRALPPHGASSVGDSIAMYLNEIGGDPLLTAEQEIALGRRLRPAIELENKLRKEYPRPQELPLTSPPLTAEEAHILQVGGVARTRLVRSNLRLVVSIAKKYVNRGLSLLDLIQEGNIGLMRAVERFDPEKGFRFSTYATWWIRQAILRALAEKARMIRIPEYMVDQIGLYQRTVQHLAQRTGREPSPEEVAAELNLDPQKVRDLVGAIQQPASLEMPVGQEGESTLGEYIPDDRTQSPEEAAVVDVLRLEVGLALNRLDPREKQVLQLRYGLDSTGRPQTLEEVARRFKLTRERIRQIESRALRKMRSPDRSNTLKDFMEER
jgi:RNA polymerase primary sigma factor